ncbi:MAG: serine protease [Myxococcota bacterium]|jgi:serine protease
MNRATVTLAGLGAVAAGVLGTGWIAPVRVLPQVPLVVPGDGPGELVVDMVDGSSDSDLSAVGALLGVELHWVHPLSQDDGLAIGSVQDIAAAVAMLDNDIRVEVVEPSIQLHALGYPNDPMLDKQWHLMAMGAPAGWAQTPQGEGIIVAVIDTGVSVVEDLDADRVLQGASFVPGVSSAQDDNGHGTHVAGTIAQSTNNGLGVAGVAPLATILPVKVLSASGSGTSEGIAAGIDYAVDEGADVINLSLGGGYSEVVHTAIRKARAQGVLVVAAAGNSGRRGVSWPGALSETIGVGAVGPDGTRAPYSSFGQGIDIAAPGGDTRIPGGGVLQDTVTPSGHAYRELQGTSMAAPHVAGAAAVLLSTGTCGPDCVEETLLTSASGKAWDEAMGHGTLDLERALSATGDYWRGLRFFLGVLAAGAIASLSGARRRFWMTAAVVGGLTAGGLFFLDNLPGLSGRWWVALLSDGPLTWPSTLLGAWAARVPLVYSAALPLALAIPLAGVRSLRPLLIGVCAGVGAVLLHAAATQSVEPWFFSGGWGSAWLVGNSTVAGLLALSLAGSEQLDQRGTE